MQKNGRGERFEARISQADKVLLTRLGEQHGATKADVLAAMIRVLNSLPTLECHAIMHGIKAWAYAPDPNQGRTVVLFNDGTRIDTHTPHTLYSTTAIAEFFAGYWWDMMLPHLVEDESLLSA